LDREVFRLHYAMAHHLGEAERNELESWYRFHLAVQDLHASLVAHSQHVQNILSGLSGKREVSQDEFRNTLSALREAHNMLREHLDAAHGLYLPPLRNMKAGEPLGPFLLTEPLIPNLSYSTQTLGGEWIGQFMNQMGEVIERAARILFKSLGGLLALQERIAERWAAPSLPEPVEPTAPLDSPSDNPTPRADEGTHPRQTG
jgi:hypothetical protein